MRDGTVPKKLFKYLLYRPDFFDELLLRITPPHEFNDPFESVFSKESILHALEKVSFETEEKRKNFLKEFNNSWENHGLISQINDYGVISLTEIGASLLMWAHYADSHKGIIIEFDTEAPNTETHQFFEGNGKLLKIKPSPINYIVDSKRGVLNTSSLGLLFLSILHFSFSKSKEWEYEKEYRMLLNYFQLADVTTKDGHFIKIPEEVISEIYMGCRAENKKEIIEKFNQAKRKNSKLKHVKICESIVDPLYFRVNYNEIHS